MTGRRVSIRVAFEPRDLWLGVYVDKPWWEMGYLWRRLYVCIVPTLPIVIVWWSRP